MAQPAGAEADRVFETVRSCIAAVRGWDDEAVAHVTIATPLFSEAEGDDALDFDSLDALELFGCIEEEFGAWPSEAPGLVLTTIRTVGDVVELVRLMAEVPT